MEDCFTNFEIDLDKGTHFMKSLNNSELKEICSNFWFSRNCVTPFLFFCPEKSNDLKIKLNNFEYACTVNRSFENWPEIPKYSDAKLDSLLKASLAACMTLCLIFLCFISSQVSAYRVTKRVKQHQKLKVVVKSLEEQAAMISGLEKQLVNSKTTQNEKSTT